jgi:hypothetical protein
MNYEDFKDIIDLYKKTFEQFSELHDMGFDFFEGKYKLSDQFSELFNYSLKTHYTSNGLEWIDWFIFESEYGTNGLKAHDNDIEICYSIESLYNYIEENHKIVNDKS